MIYQFERDPISEIILIEVLLNGKHEFKMALDTGASTTTFDINALLMANFPIGDIIESGLVETANGIVEVDIIQTEDISAFGHTANGITVQVYDFLKHGIISDYDGVLGLDFIENTKFIVDMINQTIEVIEVKKITP